MDRAIFSEHPVLKNYLRYWVPDQFLFFYDNESTLHLKIVFCCKTLLLHFRSMVSRGVELFIFFWGGRGGKRFFLLLSPLFLLKKIN